MKSSNSTEETETDENRERIHRAEEQIQSFLILGAWRREREKNTRLENDVKKLSNQVENLQMQTYALKQLLNTEKTRVAQTNTDLRKVLNALEEHKYDKKSLMKDKEELQVRLQSMEEKVTSMENECRNKKNELMTARSEAQNWEKQLEKERQKLSKLRDEKKFLVEEDVEINQNTKETANHNNIRKTTRDVGAKCGPGKYVKKNGGRGGFGGGGGGKEDRGIGKTNLKKHVGYPNDLLPLYVHLLTRPVVSKECCSSQVDLIYK